MSYVGVIDKMRLKNDMQFSFLSKGSVLVRSAFLLVPAGYRVSMRPLSYACRWPAAGVCLCPVAVSWEYILRNTS